MSGKYKSRKIVITFTSFENDVNVTDDQLTDSLNDVLHDWDEGRYPFDVEMVRLGLSRVLKIAVERAVRDRYFRETSDMSGAYKQSGEATRNYHAEIGIKDARDEPTAIRIKTDDEGSLACCCCKNVRQNRLSLTKPAFATHKGV